MSRAQPDDGCAKAFQVIRVFGRGWREGFYVFIGAELEPAYGPFGTAAEAVAAVSSEDRRRGARQLAALVLLSKMLKGEIASEECRPGRAES